MRVIDLIISESSSSKSNPIPRPESRKRATAKQILKIAKRAKECDERMFLVLTRPNY